MDTVKELLKLTQRYKEQLNQVRNVYATMLYFNKYDENLKSQSIKFGENADGNLFTKVDTYECRLLRENGDNYYGIARNLLLVSVFSIFEAFCSSLYSIAKEYHDLNNTYQIPNKKSCTEGTIPERWKNIFKAFNVDYSQIGSQDRDIELLDIYRFFRNQIAHENGKITNSFKAKVLNISNNPDRKEQLDNYNYFFISSFDFSEGVHLFEITSTSMINAIISSIR